jgi:Ni,Fe-hydrogenase maturation factor
VVFVDAAESARGPVELQPVSPGTSTQLLAHAADPATMLALAREVYGRAPEAWLLLLPAEQFGFGTELSALAEEGVAQAVREIGRLARGAV